MKAGRSYRRKGFTLVEALISCGLIAVLGLVVYSTFSGAITIWQRARRFDIREDVNIFFEKIFSDLHNGFQYKGIDFIGEKEELHFAGLVTTDSAIAGLKRGVGRISYAFNEQEKTIVRHKQNVSQVYREEETPGQPLLGNVYGCAFEYYFYDRGTKEYRWLQEWKKDRGGIPLAVRATFSVEYEGKSYEFTKTVLIPAQR
jgi:hypothetical protein